MSVISHIIHASHNSYFHGRMYRILTESLTDVRNSFEDSIRKIHFHFHILHVGKLQSEQFVLGSELELSICLNAILIQGPMCLKKPSSLLFPPESMVRPIFFYIYKKKKVQTKYLKNHQDYLERNLKAEN